MAIIRLILAPFIELYDIINTIQSWDRHSFCFTFAFEDDLNQ